jgi:hypothetical protein
MRHAMKQRRGEVGVRKSPIFRQISPVFREWMRHAVKQRRREVRRRCWVRQEEAARLVLSSLRCAKGSKETQYETKET